jgi:hypothetical protein
METEIMTGIQYCLGSLEGCRLGASDVTKSISPINREVWSVIGSVCVTVRLRVQNSLQESTRWEQKSRDS